MPGQFTYMELNMYKEKIYDIKTGEETWRDYTAEEILEIEKAQVEANARALELAEKKAARKAILEKLGLTEEEAKLLFG